MSNYGPAVHLSPPAARAARAVLAAAAAQTALTLLHFVHGARAYDDPGRLHVVGPALAFLAVAAALTWLFLRHPRRLTLGALVGRRAAHFVQGKMRALVVELVRDDLSARLPAGARRDAATAFLAGALFELLIWSLEAKPPTTAAEADARFHELAGPALSAAGIPRARVAERSGARRERD